MGSLESHPTHRQFRRQAITWGNILCRFWDSKSLWDFASQVPATLAASNCGLHLLSLVTQLLSAWAMSMKCSQGKAAGNVELTSCAPLFSKLLVLLGLPALMLCSAFKWLFSISCSTSVTVFSTSVSVILTRHPLSNAEMSPPQRGFL